jgi:translation elongation factor EF-G
MAEKKYTLEKLRNIAIISHIDASKAKKNKNGYYKV